MNPIDKFLNGITMYRLTLYVLIGLVVIGAVFCFFGLLPYNGLNLIFGTLFVLVIAWLVNTLFAWAFNTVTNQESIFISGLILCLIISPFKSLADLQFLAWGAVWIAASKYILALNKKHLFNPVAISAVLVGLALNHGVTWWIGTASMLPFVLVGGLLMVRKIRRFNLLWSFLITTTLVSLVFSLVSDGNLFISLQKIIFDSPLIFFGTVMLTEPLTTPPTSKLRILYGILTGFLYTPQIHLGSFYLTPELALIIGNGFSFLISPSGKHFLKFKQKKVIGTNIYDFIFTPDRSFNFKPGQYLEWTLGQVNLDARGNRRYFTIASSPTEPDIHLGVKLNTPSSQFKKQLMALTTNDQVMVGQLGGDFVLPDDTSQKLVFIAGGIGITPFRSIIKYLIDQNLKRDIILIYSSQTKEELSFTEIFKEAEQKMGLKIIYTLTDLNKVPENWTGEKGYISEQMISQLISDFKDRQFYLSGPNAMVENAKNILLKMGVSSAKIKTDFFPGF